MTNRKKGTPLLGLAALQPNLEPKTRKKGAPLGYLAKSLARHVNGQGRQEALGLVRLGGPLEARQRVARHWERMLATPSSGLLIILNI